MLVKILNLYILDKTVRVDFIYDLWNTSPQLNKDMANDSESSLSGNWVGKTPQQGRWYDVEIAMDDLIWGANTFEIGDKDKIATISKSNTDTLLQGELDISESGFVTLQLGRSLAVCNLVGFSKPGKTFVQIQTTKLVLYDTDTLRY